MCDGNPKYLRLLTIILDKVSTDDDSQDLKKLRRSQRLSQTQSPKTPVNQSYLPTPLTEQNSNATDIKAEVTATPPNISSQALSRSPQPQSCSSPPGDTQALSQFVYPPRAFADEVEDEAAEGVWGYLIPLDDKVREALVLRKRDGCERTKTITWSKTEAQPQAQGGTKLTQSPGGYLVGRHPECGRSWTYLCEFIV